MNRKLIYGLIAVIFVQEIRFERLRRAVLDTVVVMKEFLDAQDQEYVDNQFEGIVDETLADLDGLGDDI